ncbi:MAG: L-aspartate oxidase [Lachnospiraceae bacterium]|nr:L-aspartate oxidase [Lachnospiraceae bacterium]
MSTEKKMKTDVVIVGTGAAGLFCALHFTKETNVLLVCKTKMDESDSYLAQGGICMLRGEEDYDSYFEDTMRAGHYENNKESVDIMLRSSQDIIRELIGYGVRFEHDGEELSFTREGGHSKPRILFHADCTGKEITGTLLENVKRRENITILDHTTMLDILSGEGEASNHCHGIVVQNASGEIAAIWAKYTVLACGGLGGIFEHSTNFRHITGDAFAIAKRHGIVLEHMDYIQIHPTTLYSRKPGRRFLISESVRGEGAVLLDRDKKRFCDELQPRDVVTAAIREQMKKDHMPYVWLSMEKIPEEEIRSHFPNILKECLSEGYDPTKECIPVVPAQHYFMGGIKVNSSSRTSMERLYAVGEASCNGVHGKNRLASNSLLESMVFAGRAAKEISKELSAVHGDTETVSVDLEQYRDVKKLLLMYQEILLEEIEEAKKGHDAEKNERQECSGKEPGR